MILSRSDLLRRMSKSAPKKKKAFAPADDVLGRPRGAAPDLGAYEVGASGMAIRVKQIQTLLADLKKHPLRYNPF